MQEINSATYAAFRENARVIESDAFGEKVLQLADGSFLKIFRRKKLLSKSLLFPPAKRFAKNAVQLTKLGIPCPSVIEVYTLRNPYRSLVHYHPLQGVTLRQLMEQGVTPERQTQLLHDLAEFINKLHDIGIYFRSLHLGNIVHTDDNCLGLIDISDMRILGKSLPPALRRRNYRHLMRYEQDWKLATHSQRSDFLRHLDHG